MHSIKATEWKRYKFRDLTLLMTNGFVGSAAEHYVESGGVPYLMANNVREDGLDLRTIEQVSQQFHLANPRSHLVPGDVLTVQTGFVGVSALVTDQFRGANTHALIISRPNRAHVRPEFLNYWLNSDVGNRIVLRIQTGGGRPHLNTKDLAEAEVTLPPLAHQAAIVEIAGAWDRMILRTKAETQRLQRRRTALLQQLLTGKRRFPGFARKWQTRLLRDFFRPHTESNRANAISLPLSCSKVHGIVPQSTIFEKRIASEDVRRYQIVRKGDLVYDPMLLWDGSIGFLDCVEVGVISPAYNCFRFSHPSANKEWFRYLFQSQYMRHQYGVISQGTNVRRRKAPAEAFLDLPIEFPADPAEQLKVIEVLKLADRELELLRDLQIAYRTQKRGLLQQLLTGKRRVPMPTT